MRHAAARPVPAREHGRTRPPASQLAPLVLLPALGLLALAVAAGVALVALGVVDPLVGSSAGATASGSSAGPDTEAEVGLRPAVAGESTRRGPGPGDPA